MFPWLQRISTGSPVLSGDPTDSQRCASSAAEGRVTLCTSPLLALCLDTVKVSRHMHQEKNYSQIISRKMTALGWLPLRYSKYEGTTKYRLNLNTNGGRRGRGFSPKPSTLQQCTYKGALIIHTGQMCTLGDTLNIRQFSHCGCTF